MVRRQLIHNRKLSHNCDAYFFARCFQAGAIQSIASIYCPQIRILPALSFPMTHIYMIHIYDQCIYDAKKLAYDTHSVST